jgi:hypothetical protein
MESARRSCASCRRPHEANSVSFRDPAVPASLDYATLHQSRLGKSRLDLQLHRHGGDATLNLLHRQGNAKVMLVKCSARKIKASQRRGPRPMVAHRNFARARRPLVPKTHARTMVCDGRICLPHRMPAGAPGPKKGKPKSPVYIGLVTMLHLQDERRHRIGSRDRDGQRA